MKSAASILGLLVAQATGAAPLPGPTAQMMAPIRALSACMASGLPSTCALPFASRGISVSEDFPPYLFAGTDAVGRWASGFRLHLAVGGDQDLSVEFGPAQDFSQDRGRTYFSVPTTWRGVSQGRHFEEHGAWSFVLVESAGQYRILGYAWGVTDLRETTIP
jgi:hypothetical protein